MSKSKQNMYRGDVCTVEGCNAELPEGARSTTCKNCRASIGAWKRRPLRDVLLRRARLRKYDTRMVIVEEEKKTGVKS